MNENEVDANGLQAVARVLRNPEMLDTIFSFVELKTLLKLRVVCRQWRLVSNLSLKRRFWLRQLTHTHSHSIPGYCQNGMETFFVSLRQMEKSRNTMLNPAHSVFEINLILKDACYCPDHLSEVAPDVALVCTVLNIDWPSRVKTLVISGCLTIEHWNAIGVNILNKFPSVRRSIIDLPKTTSHVLPLCYAEFRNEHQDEEDAVLELNNFQLQCKLPLLDQENPVGFCYDFLTRCPKLEKLHIAVDWSSEDGSAPWYSVTLSDSNLEVFEEIEHAENSRKYEPVIIQDILKLFQVLPLQPSKLSIPLHPKMISGVQPRFAANLVDLSLQGCSVPGVFEDALEALITNPAFGKVKKLQWDTACRRNFRTTINSSAIKSLGMLTTLTEVRTLVFHSSEGLAMNARYEDELEDSEWMWTDINKITPNVKVVVLFFSDEAPGELKSERNALLRLAKSFSQLKHLLLVDERLGFSNPESSCTDLTEDELECLQGLSSITAVVHKTSWFEDYLKVYARACLSAPSIRKLGVYRPNMIHDRLVDEIMSTAGLVVPEGLVIETGSQDLLEGNLSFDGVEDSHLEWEEVRSFLF